MRAAWRRMRRAETRLASGLTTLVGVDEAGRGPLAGPVVAAAVTLDVTLDWSGLDDSKLMSPDLRAELFLRLLERARAVRWAVMGPRNVDRMNIRGASLAAMRKAVAALGVVPELVIVDGRDTIPGVAFPQLPIIDGDAQMLSIAAASVVAKVVRDRIMERLDRVWPAYGFAQHKGYGTPEHLAALSKLGPCPIHRFSFTPVCVQELPLEV